MAFKAVSNCLKTGTELIYIGLVMVVPWLVCRVTLFKWATPIDIYRESPNASRGSPSNGNVCVYRSRSLPQGGHDGFRNVQSGRLPFVVGRLLPDAFDPVFHRRVSTRYWRPRESALGDAPRICARCRGRPPPPRGPPAL